MTNDVIGRRIRERRSEMDVSVVELAARLSMSKSTLHRYENGEIRKIKLPVIDAIARELSVNPMWLLGKSEDKDRVLDENSKPDLKHIVEDFIEFMSADGVMCCGKPMNQADRMAVVSLLEAVQGMVVNKYK